MYRKNIIEFYLTAILIAFLIMAAFSGISQAKVNIDWQKTIDLNKYLEIPLVEVKAGDIMDVSIQITSGGEVDLFLMTPSEFETYKAAIKQMGAISYVADGSILKTTYKQYTYTFKDPGDYYFVIDNTYEPKGGASPLNQVELSLKLSVTTPTGGAPSNPALTQAASEGASSTPVQKTPGFEWIISTFVIIIVAIWKK